MSEPPRVRFGARNELDVPIDAIVEEEDTYLALSGETVLRLPGEPPIRVMTEAREIEEAQPGSVVVRDGRPLRLLAVVHKLDQDPTWRETWIGEAVENLVQEVRRRQIHALALPLLGTVHGKLDPGRSLELLGPLLRSATASGLRDVWVFRDP